MVDGLSHAMLSLVFCRMLAQNLIDIALCTVQVQAQPFLLLMTRCALRHAA